MVRVNCTARSYRVTDEATGRTLAYGTKGVTSERVAFSYAWEFANFDRASLEAKAAASVKGWTAH